MIIMMIVKIWPLFFKKKTTNEGGLCLKECSSEMMKCLSKRFNNEVVIENSSQTAS